jgi:copper chaperone CopZ
MKRALIIPLGVAMAILLAFATMNAYRVPTADISFVEEEDRPAVVATVEFEVSGLKCRGTARTFTRQVQDLPGVLNFVAYTRTHTAIVEYDPALTNRDAIREAFERPILHEGKTYEIFRMVSVTAE